MKPRRLKIEGLRGFVYSKISSKNLAVISEVFLMEPLIRFELMTSSLPWMRSTY